VARETLGRQIAPRAPIRGDQGALHSCGSPTQGFVFLQELGWASVTAATFARALPGLDYALEAVKTRSSTAATATRHRQPQASTTNRLEAASSKLISTPPAAREALHLCVRCCDAEKATAACRDGDPKYMHRAVVDREQTDYTILRCCGLHAGVIGQFAMPVLESQTVW